MQGLLFLSVFAEGRGRGREKGKFGIRNSEFGIMDGNFVSFD